jgi:D-alanyl-D-alanine carboxypeptidase
VDFGLITYNKKAVSDVRTRLSIRNWGLGLLVCGSLLLLASASWAQFQVNQRRGWTPFDWSLDSQLPLTPQIQMGLERETAINRTVVGQLVHIKAPALGLDNSFGAGKGVLASDDVRVASNIKPFVAAAALKLVETGQLKLDAPIAPYLSTPVRSLLTKSKVPIDQISLKNLLNHSSGIADYGSSKLFQICAYIPTAFGLAWHWTALDQIWFAANFTPRAQVGAQFDYSDTNYLLASDMIATASKAPNAGVAVRRLLNWPALGARETFWEGYERTPQSTRLVRHFRGAIEDTNLDVSFDQYGGGGLVMDMDDLANAHRSVVRGEVFSDPQETLALMQTSGAADGSDGYGLGITSMVIEGEACWGHGGRWGTMALHCPKIDLTVARSWGQSNAGPDMFAPKGLIVQLIRRAQEAAR